MEAKERDRERERESDRTREICKGQEERKNNNRMPEIEQKHNFTITTATKKKI